MINMEFLRLRPPRARERKREREVGRGRKKGCIVSVRAAARRYAFDRVHAPGESECERERERQMHAGVLSLRRRPREKFNCGFVLG